MKMNDDPEWLKKKAELEACVRLCRETLDFCWAAIGDRLLAEGPLAEPYANEVAADVKKAIAAADKLLPNGCDVSVGGIDPRDNIEGDPTVCLDCGMPFPCKCDIRVLEEEEHEL